MSEDDQREGEKEETIITISTNEKETTPSQREMMKQPSCKIEEMNVKDMNVEIEKA